MAKRIGVSKRVRFEVFKRDEFVCRYCGAHPPAAILHVDHVVPVSRGGTNDINNLVTSCDACNLGKSAEPLSSVPKPLQLNVDEAREREAQIRGYQDVMRERAERLECEVKTVVEIYERLNPDWTLSDRGCVSVRHFIEQLGVVEVSHAMEKASVRKAGSGDVFRYFCGICWNIIKRR